MSEPIARQAWRAAFALCALSLAAVALTAFSARWLLDALDRLDEPGVEDLFGALRAGVRYVPPVAALLAAGVVARTVARLRQIRRKAGVPEGLRLTPHGARPVCPMCKDDLAPVDLVAGVVRCPTCEVAHHGECWREHGGCATLACGRSPQEREKARERVGG